MPYCARKEDYTGLLPSPCSECHRPLTEIQGAGRGCDCATWCDELSAYEAYRAEIATLVKQGMSQAEAIRIVNERYAKGEKG